LTIVADLMTIEDILILEFRITILDFLAKLAF